MKTDASSIDYQKRTRTGTRMAGLKYTGGKAIAFVPKKSNKPHSVLDGILTPPKKYRFTGYFRGSSIPARSEFL